MSDTVLVTGVAGFIGFHTARRLLAEGRVVIGVDNLNAYYEPALKQARLDQLLVSPQFEFIRLDLADRPAVDALFADHPIDRVIHLAAQAGVRHSITHPHDYSASNLTAFLHILEACRAATIQHLVFASSSSVYGANKKIPFSVTDNVDSPVSLYAATKKANELMAHSYAHLYQLPVTGLRFFTVYGPWGRPDMAYFSFTKAILAGKPIDVFNHGDMRRDFTYIDDVVDGIIRVLDRAPVATQSNDDTSLATPPYRLYNIGNNQPVKLLDFIAVLEHELNTTAIRNFLPMQAGDVPETYADIDPLINEFGYSPQTSIKQGLHTFVRWYREYYG